MRRADWLVFTTVLGSTGTVLLVLAATLMLAGLVDELGARSDTYTLVQLLAYVCLTTPDRLGEVMPFMVLVGTLLGLSRLAATSELVVLSVSGQSRRRLVLALLAPTSVTIGLAVLVGEFLAPGLSVLAEERKQVAIATNEAIWIPGGRWHRERDRFVHARAISRDGTLYGVTEFLLGSDEELQAIGFVRSAVPIGPGLWRREGASSVEFDGDDVRVESAAMPLRMDPVTSLLTTRSLLDPVRLSLAELAMEIRFRARHGIGSHDQQLAWWQRLCRPLTAVGTMLVGLGLVVGAGRDLARGARMALAVALGVGLQYLVELVGPLSAVYGLAPPLAAASPAVLALAGGLWVALREH